MADFNIFSSPGLAFQFPQHLDVYDLRGASSDVQLAITTLVGIINRSQPKVYVLLGDDDDAWLKRVLPTVPHDLSPAVGDAALHAILTAYHPVLKGIVIYDLDLIDTINVATTLAGQRDGMVVSPTLAQTIRDAYALPVLDDLRNYHWSTRLQAYHWAEQNLLANASPYFVAGLDPGSVAGLRSFLVATRTFVYWLDSRSYLPDLRAGFLSERSLLAQILARFSSSATHLGWFIDESSGVNLTSRSGIPVLASDFFNNLEVWAAVQFELTVSHAQDRALPNIEEDKIYLSFTMSDGDNLQYMQHRMFHLWNDAARGSLPIGWTFSPAISRYAPPIAQYYLSTATENDELIAGPSGVGYMFPSFWPGEQLPSFLQNTAQLMQALGITTLEVLDSTFIESSGLPIISGLKFSGMAFTNQDLQQRFVTALKPYGVQGLLSGSGVLLPDWKKIDTIPLYHNLGLVSSVKHALWMTKAAGLARTQRPLFLNLYILAWSMTPTDLAMLVQQLGDEYRIVLPKMLLALLAKSL